MKIFAVIAALAVFSCGLSTKISAEPISLEDFQSLTLREQLQELHDAVQELQSVATGEMLHVNCEARERALVPKNYGVTRRPTEPLRWGPVQRLIRYEFKFDGMHGSESMSVSDGTGPRRTESGHNGEREVHISKIGKQETSASIRCSNPRMWKDLPGLYSQGLRLLYYSRTRDGPDTFVMEVLRSATQVDLGRTLNGQRAVAVDAPGEFNTVDTAYFSLEPSIRLVGLDLNKGGPTLFRYEYFYGNKSKPLIPTGGTRDALARDETGNYSSILTHTELKFNEVRFTKPLSPDEYLPVIPRGVSVDTDCEPLPPTPAIGVSQPDSRSWVWLVILLTAIVLSGGIFWRWFGKRKNPH